MTGASRTLFDRPALVLLRPAVVEGVAVVLDRDLRHLLRRCAELVHVPLGHVGVVAGVVASDGEVEVGVRGEGDELVALLRVHLAHLLKAVDQADLGEARGYVHVPCPNSNATGGAAGLDAHRRLRAHGKVVLGQRVEQKLAVEVVGEVGADGGLDVPQLQPSVEVVEGVVQRILAHSFLGQQVRLGELGYPARDNANS